LKKLLAVFSVTIMMVVATCSASLALSEKGLVKLGVMSDTVFIKAFQEAGYMQIGEWNEICIPKGKRMQGKDESTLDINEFYVRGCNQKTSTAARMMRFEHSQKAEGGIVVAFFVGTKDESNFYNFFRRIDQDSISVPRPAGSKAEKESSKANLSEKSKGSEELTEEMDSSPRGALAKFLKGGDARINSARGFIKKIGAERILSAMKAHGSDFHVFIDDDGSEYPIVFVDGKNMEDFDHPRPNGIKSLYFFKATEVKEIQEQIEFEELIEDVKKIKVHVEINNTYRSYSDLDPEGTSRVDKIGAEMEGFEIDETNRDITMHLRLKGAKETIPVNFCKLDRAISNKDPEAARKVNDLKSLLCD